MTQQGGVFADIRVLTNRWSSRLVRCLELRVRSRKEPPLLAVVGGAAQLNVIHAQARSTAKEPIAAGSSLGFHRRVLHAIKVACCSSSIQKGDPNGS
jgi:hypothetical protein